MNQVPKEEFKLRRVLFLIFVAALFVFAVLSPFIPGFTEFMNAPRTKVGINLFPIAFIIGFTLHGLFTRTIRRDGPLGERQVERVRTLERKLLFWSALVSATTVALAIGFPDEKIFAYANIAMMVIIFLIYEPLLNAKNPDRKSVWKFPERIRGANLKPRSIESPLSNWTWCTLWLVWIPVAVVAYLDVQHTLTQNSYRWLYLEDTLVCLTISGGAIFIGPWLLRWWLHRPEPIIESERVKLEEAYEGLRRLKGWCVYLISASIALPFLLFLYLDSTGGDPGGAILILIVAPGLIITPAFLIYMQRRSEILSLLNKAEKENPPEPRAAA